MTSPTTHPPCSPVAYRAHRTRRAAILTAIALAGGAGVSLLLACGSKTGSVDAVTETGNPPFLDETHLEVRAVDGKVVVAGRAGSVPGGAAVQLTNETSGDSSRTTADDEGAFEVEVSGDPGDELSLEVESGAESRSFDLSSAVGAPIEASERDQPAPSGEPAPAPAAQPADPSEPLNIIVLPDENGDLPAELWIGCENGPEFQAADLDEVVFLSEGDPGGVAEAIEPFLSGGEGQFWPQDDWMILRETADEILLVYSDDTELAFMNVSREDGEWVWSGSRTGTGPCPLYYLVPDGLNTVDWHLAPGESPDANATTLDVVVSERECVSGQAVDDRLLSPQVVMTDDALRIAFAAEPPPGDAFDCPSNPETRVTVELPEPLGDRAIFEGLAIGIELVDFLP